MADQKLAPESHADEAGQSQSPEQTSTTGPRRPAHLVPPQPNYNAENVYKFSAIKEGLLNTTLVDNASRSLFRTEKTGPRSFVLLTGDGTEYARVENGKVSIRGGEEIKASNFLCKNTGKTGNTGPVFHHNGQKYEWVQENFYAIIRATPGGEPRVAIIYNFVGEPAIELLPDGQNQTDLLATLVLSTALMESGFFKHGLLSRLLSIRSK